MTAVELTSQATERLYGWLSEQLHQINVVGVGTAALSPSWSPPQRYVRSVICDPLAGSAVQTESRVVRAFAVSAYGGEDQLNVTRDPARSSLLEPNWQVLARHAGLADFDIVERRTVPCVTLPQLALDHGPIDVLRLQCQGLEYQLLSSALTTAGNAMCLDIDGGMIDNYVGQYPFTVVSGLLRGAGYSLVDLTCTARPGATSGPDTRHQPLEYRGLWLRDYLMQREGFSFHQAIKLLVLCRQLGYLSFGRELSIAMHGQSLLPDDHARLLRRESFWRQPWRLGDRPRAGH
jgi:hypothetical protein